MSPRGKPLTDAQLAAIAWADPGESTADLTRRVGGAYATVSRTRRRISQAGGWWCELQRTTCLSCAQPLLINPNTTPRLRHRACQRQHRAELDRATPERIARRRASLERNRPAMDAVARRDDAESRQRATRNDEPWTPAEDARLLRVPREAARDLARAFGRTLVAVYMRRSRLRRQRRADGRRSDPEAQ